LEFVHIVEINEGRKSTGEAMSTYAEVTQNLLTRLTSEMAQNFRTRGLWSDTTIYCAVRQNAENEPDRPAIRDRHGVVSYGALIRLADGVAAELDAAGLRPGDRVAARLSSRLETAVFFLACSRDGYVFCPSLHRTHTAAEVSDLLRRMRASAFVVEEGSGVKNGVADILAMVGSLESIRKIYRLRAIDAASSRQNIASVAGAAAPSGVEADAIVYLAFTSGTSGEPKGVLHSNNTLLANARALADDWGFDRDSVVYSISPLSHNLGFGAMVLTLFVGGELVLHDLPREASLLARLRETKTTFIFGVPTHAIDLVSEIEAAGGALLPNLRGFRISGSAAPTGLVEKLFRYGIVPQSGYGMTEACSHHYTMPDDEPAVVAATSGRACRGYEVAIFDVNDPASQLPSGTVGQIGGRGASLMLGYFDDREATEAAFNAAGWFMTGDIGSLDERRYLRVIGRLKDVIIRGGRNIYPARIEMLAMRDPQVDRAAVVGVKDERLGERVCIVVSGKNGIRIEPDRLLSHLHAQGLSPYDMPEYFLQVESLPLSASGKVLKRALIDPMGSAFRPRPVRWRE
jgi:acyl-CoA synthetase (AMP-forming)/AMP-acid ligase II